MIPKKIVLSCIEYKSSVFAVNPPLLVYLSEINGGKTYMTRCEEIGEELTVEDVTPDGAVTMMCAKLISLWDDALDHATAKWSMLDEIDLIILSRIQEVCDKPEKHDLPDIEEEWEKIFRKYLVK